MQLQNYVNVGSPWELFESLYVSDQAVTTGSNYMTGNGYLGYRGTFPDARKDDYVACVVTDTYDNADGVWEELVTVPNGLYLTIDVDGEPFEWATEAGAERGGRADERGQFRRAINLRYGEWQGAIRSDRRGIEVRTERFASLSDLHAVVMRTRVRSIRESDFVRLTVRAGIDGEVWSLNGDHLRDISLAEDGEVLLATATTSEKGTDLAVGSITVVSSDLGLSPETEVEHGAILRVFSFELAPGQEIAFDTMMAAYSANDVRHEKARGSAYGLDFLSDKVTLRTPPDDVRGGVTACLRTLDQEGYSGVLARHRAVWDSIWKDLDIQITTEPETQAVLRFNLYHSVIATPYHTDHLPIGARGLSCQAYQGAAFWDQEIFNLPMFLFSRPEVARNILTYRHRTITGARNKARKLGYRGAFYAWVSADTGEEICPSYFFKDVISGRPIRNHFNDWQIHISPDIVYSIRKYHAVTGDTEFLYSRGAEIVFDVARFLVSRVHLRIDAGEYQIIRVLGPDEYHENVDDNFFTNYQARFALEYAVELYREMRASARSRLEALTARLGLDPAEVAQWDDVADRLFVASPRPEDGVIEQFRGFFQLEDVRPTDLEGRLLDPGEYWGWPNGVAVETQVSKQADVMQLFALHPDAFDRETIKANWEYYEPRTQHGSSLSPAVYAMTAAWVGHLDEAERYFWHSCTVDLHNSNRAVSGGTFIGGIHTAACGVAWQIVVVGFLGMRLSQSGIGFSPHLPESWSHVRCVIRIRGSRLVVAAGNESVEVHCDDESDQGTTVTVGEKTRFVSPGESVTFPYS